MSRRVVVVFIALGLTAVLITFGLAFSNASNARAVAENSQLLHWANGSSGSAAVGRAGLHQALVFAVDLELGVATAESELAARTEATATMFALDEWLEVAPPQLETQAAALAELQATGRDVIDALATGDLVGADSLLSTDFETEYRSLTTGLGAAQDRFATAIALAESDASQMERLSQLIVTLLIPAGAIIIHQLFIRRQVRDRRLQMDAKIEAERELSRSKDAFIAGMSHELRTPLTSIYGFSEYLLDRGLIDPDEAIELISMINRDSSELSRMIEDLLVAARVESSTLQLETSPVDLLGVVRNESHRLRTDATTVAVNGDPTFAWADPMRAAHIVRNLISNAVRYGGRNIEVTVGATQGVATVTVADNGEGVPDEEKLFERFVNDGDQTLLKGSIGLGLSVGSALAAAMGGTLGYERKLGWTSFTIALPEAPANIVAAATDSPPLPPLTLPPNSSANGGGDLLLGANASRDDLVVMFDE